MFSGDTHIALQAAEIFYEMAKERDIQLSQNLIQKIYGVPYQALLNHEATPHREKVVAAITGGFHTQAISSFLKKNGIPYTVITPNVTTLDQDFRYRQVMGGSSDASTLMRWLIANVSDSSATKMVHHYNLSDLRLRSFQVLHELKGRLGQFIVSPAPLIHRVTSLSPQHSLPITDSDQATRQSALYSRIHDVTPSLNAWMEKLDALEIETVRNVSTSSNLTIEDLESFIAFQRNVALGYRIDPLMVTMGSSFAKQVAMSFYYASDAALRTVRLIEKEVQFEKNVLRRERLIREMEEFRLFGRYTLHAGHALMFSRDILAQVDSYFLLNNHWIEKTGLGAHTRRLFGIHGRVLKDKEILLPELTKALEFGDALFPHLYNGNSSVIRDQLIRSLDVDVLTKPDPVKRHENEMLDVLRKISTRMISIFGLTYSVISMGINLANHGSISSTSIYGILIAVSVWGLHRLANWIARKDFRYQRLLGEWKQIHESIQERAVQEHISLENKFEAVETAGAYQALSAQLEKTAISGGDELIVLLVDKNQPLISEQDIESRRGILFGRNAQVHLIAYDGVGSLNALAYAYQETRQILQQRSGVSPNVGVLMMGGPNQSFMSMDLETMPVVPHLNRSPKLWESQLMNLYAGLASVEHARRTSHMVVVGADNHYVGGWHGFEAQLQHAQADWIFGASMMSLDQAITTKVTIAQMRMDHTPKYIFEPSLTEKATHAAEQGVPLPKGLSPNGNVDIQNPMVEQISALNDMHIFNLASPKIQTLFRESSEMTLPMSLTHDALVTGVREMNGSSHDTLFATSEGVTRLDLGYNADGRLSDDTLGLIQRQQKLKLLIGMMKGVAIRGVIPSRSSSYKHRHSPEIQPALSPTPREIAVSHPANIVVSGSPKFQWAHVNVVFIILGVVVLALLLVSVDLQHVFDSMALSSAPHVSRMVIEQGVTTATKHVLTISPHDVHGLGDAILRVIRDGSDPELAQALKGSLWGDHGTVARVWETIASQAAALDVNDQTALAARGITRTTLRSVNQVLVGDTFDVSALLIQLEQVSTKKIVPVQSSQSADGLMGFMILSGITLLSRTFVPVALHLVRTAA